MCPADDASFSNDQGLADANSQFTSFLARFEGAEDAALDDAEPSDWCIVSAVDQCLARDPCEPEVASKVKVAAPSKASTVRRWKSGKPYGDDCSDGENDTSSRNDAQHLARLAPKKAESKTSQTRQSKRSPTAQRESLLMFVFFPAVFVVCVGCRKQL